MAPHSKINISGLAGLVLLIPVLCFFYLYDTGVSQPIKAIEMAMPLRDSDIEPEDTLDNKMFLFYNPRVRDYKDIQITGNENDAKQLKLGRRLIQKLRFDNDTVNGVRIYFGKNAKYNEFVKAVTICNEEKASGWMLKGNYMYIHYERQQPVNSPEAVTPIYL